MFGAGGPPVTSTKGVTGHLVGAAGAVEAVFGLLAAAAGIVPPVANLADPDVDPEVDLVRGEVRDRSPPAPVLSNSFGFGGHNTSLVLAPALTARRSTRRPLGAHRPGRGTRPTCARSTAARSPTPRSTGCGPAAAARPRPRRWAGPWSWPSSSACPVVVWVHSVAVDPGAGGLDGLAAWGRVARRAVRLSGVVPLLVVVTGPGARRPRPRARPGRPRGVHPGGHRLPERPRSGAARSPGRASTPTSWAAPRSTPPGPTWPPWWRPTPRTALLAVADLLAHLPDNYLDRRPRAGQPPTPADRPSTVAARTVPTGAKQSYDVRDVLDDVFDAD